MIHMLSSDFLFLLSRLASTSKGVEIMVLHHTQGRYIHQGSRLIYFQFLLFLTSWRELCGLSAVKSWKMLAKIFPENIVPRLQAIYDKVGGWSNWILVLTIKSQTSPQEKFPNIPTWKSPKNPNMKIWVKVEDVDLFVGGLLESAEEVLYSTTLQTDTTMKQNFPGYSWTNFSLLGWWPVPKA